MRSPAFSPKGSLRIAPTGSLKRCGEHSECDRRGSLFNLQKVNKSEALTLNRHVAHPTHGAPNARPAGVPGCSDHVCPSRAGLVTTPPVHPAARPGALCPEEHWGRGAGGGWHSDLLLMSAFVSHPLFSVLFILLALAPAALR